MRPVRSTRAGPSSSWARPPGSRTRIRPGLTPACNSIGRAAWFVEQVARSNVGIAVDALHLARTGGTPAEIAALPAHHFAYAQICDGRGFHRSADYLPEALDRMMPGDGEFPLRAIIEALPQATALDVEVPSVKLANAGVPAIEADRTYKRPYVGSGTGRGELPSGG